MDFKTFERRKQMFEIIKKLASTLKEHQGARGTQVGPLHLSQLEELERK